MGFQARSRPGGLRVFGILLALSLPLWSQQTARPAPKKAVADPKCAFLRSEARRNAADALEYSANNPLSAVNSPESLAAANQTIDGWADYVATAETFTAHRTILGLAVSACERGVPLSDLSRLSGIENARASQIRRATQRWQTLAGDQGAAAAQGIIDRVNSVYEAETKSFYNRSTVRFADPDIAKDYPDLPSMIQGSALDQGTKELYSAALSYLKYEEAGRLANILRGVDKELSLNYAYLLRKTLADRADIDANQRNQVSSEQFKKRTEGLMHYAMVGLALLVILVLLRIGIDPILAKYRAFRLGLKRSPFWFGNAEWIFWEPGETVVLLKNKRLTPMTDAQGGYRIVSAWNGQEYKGRISYKTQFSTWKSDPIITSDGLPINLELGIWWRIADASLYVSKIASDYHEGEQHKSENLAEAAEFWIKKLAAGTLRQEVNQLPAEKLISPYVQSYLQIQQVNEEGSPTAAKPLPNFSDQLDKSKLELNEKTRLYGIEIERLEVQELILPPVYQQKLEAVRVAFLEPTQARALSAAQVIALKGLASVIGEEKVGLIEVLKHVDLSHVAMNPFSPVVPIVQPMINTLNRQSEKALPPGESK
jgi:regulator of protease activity HflC (stomatin/prohibitin superfamily)